MHAHPQMYAPDYAAKEWQERKRFNHEVTMRREYGDEATSQASLQQCFCMSYTVLVFVIE